MKAEMSGRSIGAARSVGSVGLLGRGSGAERSGGISSRPSGRPSNPGLRITSYLNPGISQRRSSIEPEGSQVSSKPVRNSSKRPEQASGFRPLSIPDNLAQKSQENRVRHHRRIPRRSYIEAHQSFVAKKAIQKQLSEIAVQPATIIPLTSETRRIGVINQIQRPLVQEALTIPRSKKVKPSESSAWEGMLFRKALQKTTAVPEAKPVPIPTRRIVGIADNAFPTRRNSVTRPRERILDIPSLQRMRFARPNNLDNDKLSLNTVITPDEKLVQKKRTTSVLRRLSRRTNTLPDEELDQDEDRVQDLKPSQWEDSKKQTTKKNKTKLKFAELIKSAVENIKRQTEDSEKEEKKNKVYGIDSTTNKARLAAIATFRNAVTRASSLIGITPNWADVAYLLHKNQNDSLKSELVRGSRRDDGSLKEIENELKMGGVIFPEAKPDAIVLGNTAVTAPKENVLEKAKDRDVQKVLGTDVAEDLAA